MNATTQPTTTATRLTTVGELKRALKDADAVLVHASWSPRRGNYIEVGAKQVIRDLGLDQPVADGGLPDDFPVRATFSEGSLFVG